MAKGTRKTKKAINTNVAPKGYVMVPKKTFTKFNKLIAGIERSLDGLGHALNAV